MKKFCALVFCTLLNASFFVFGWHLILSGYSSVFLFYIAPVLSAATFLFLSRLFYRLIRLDRTGLWLTMNIMGEYMGWVGLSYLTERTPEMLKNLLGFMRVVLTRFAVFAVIWVAIWAASLLLHKLKEQGVNCPRLLLRGAGVLLCLLSVGALGFSYHLQQLPAGAGMGTALLLVSGLYLAVYVAFQLHGREKRRIALEEHSEWRKAE